MNEKEYHNLTKDFPDISELLDERKSLKNDLNKINRKLKTLSDKYEFLRGIIHPKISNDELEQYIKMYFKDIGFEKVRKVGKQLKKDDIRIFLPDKIIIIEVTGTKKKHPTDNKTRQITKHLEVRRHKKENAFGVFIINHDNNKSYKEKDYVPFTLDQIGYADAGKYSLVTTMELVKGFIKVKMNELTLDEFENKLCSFGLVEF